MMKQVVRISLVGLFLLAPDCDLSAPAEKDLVDALIGIIPEQPPGNSSSANGACYVDTFYQPAEQILHSVDILFIADTSGSMAPKRVKVAEALYAFAGALPAGTDYRIGVILAHGSNDPNSGRLYTSSAGIPKVLDSSSMSQLTIQNNLKQIMLDAPDYNNEQGEMGSYALTKALSASRLAESRSLGFFRTDAALAVVTISDENDICAVYPNPIPSEFTLTGQAYPAMPGMVGSEYSIRQRDCAGGISSASVVNAIKAVQGTRPFVIGGVIHTDLNYYQAGTQDNYGWGYAQTIADQHGVQVDISSGDYSSGLSSLGALTTTKIQLLSEFELGHQNVLVSSIQATVDGAPAQFEYNAAQNEVHLFDLGNPRSRVDVQYCLNTATATDTSTDTSTNTSTGTDTSTGTGTGTSTGTDTATDTSTSTDTNTDTNSDWQILGFDGTTTSDGATLIWQTPGAATTAVIQVGLAPDQLNLLSIPVNDLSSVHVGTISGLSPNTLYYFQVTATDRNGLTHTSYVISKATKSP
jgi:hypothetical protein